MKIISHRLRASMSSSFHTYEIKILIEWSLAIEGKTDVLCVEIDNHFFNVVQYET